jgi:hypothetical protein
MQLIEVKEKHEIREFHKLPFEIYKNDKNWIPHLQQDIEKIFNPKTNKAFRGGKAIRWILKNNSGQCIGRIAAFIDPKYYQSFKQSTGGFGFFECINDKESAYILLNIAKEWLHEQGMKAMDGPINFGEKNEYWGLLVQNADYPANYQMNYHPAYYQDFFESYGMQAYYHQYVFWRDLERDADEIFQRKANQLWDHPDFKITNVKGFSDQQLADYFLTVYNEAWGKHAGFKPMKMEQALKIMKAIKPVKDERITLFAFFQNKPIAFYINLPELNHIFKHVNGNLNLWGKIKFLYYKNFVGSSTMYGIVFGVIPEFQGQGVEAAVIKYGGKHIRSETNYADTILTWIGDFNVKMLKVCKNLNASLLRTLTTYRYMIDNTIPFERAPFIGGTEEDVKTIINSLTPLEENMKKYGRR